MAKNNTILIIGAAAAAVFVLPKLMGSSGSSILPSSTSSTSAQPGATTSVPGVVQAYGTYVLQGAPPPPSQWLAGSWPTISKPYYLQYEYPAHQKINPNIVNSGYTMTDAEAQQYLNNYADINQWANSTAANGGVHQWGSALNAAKKHWQTFQPAEQRTFLPLVPPFTGVWVPPVSNPNTSTSSSGSSWVSTALTIGTTLVGLLGPNDAAFTDADLEIIATGGFVVQQVAECYMNVKPKMASAILAKLDSIIKQYA